MECRNIALPRHMRVWGTWGCHRRGRRTGGRPGTLTSRGQSNNPTSQTGWKKDGERRESLRSPRDAAVPPRRWWHGQVQEREPGEWRGHMATAER